ncbi:UNVERIFIED_CONTAM: hypothetical protein FKN15_042605 [Acipenser sinensis]
MPAVSKGDGMRGLAVFISDIRNCKSKEAEIKRINKELANIRSKFKGDKALDGYSKKKYVCKLLFIFLLGHDIDFGHMEAVNLLSSNRYTEKQIGYLFISVLVNSNSELIRLINNGIKNDLASRNPTFMNLALHCIANVGSREMAEAFTADIPKILVAGDTMDSVKQSAALCLLRLNRTSPDLVPMGEWTSRVVHLLNDQHLCYPPPEEGAVRGRLTECLETILNKAQEPPKSKKVQHSNAKNAVLFEAISLIIHHDSEPNLLVRACNQLGQFLQHRETNLRYLALESMCTLASSEFSHEAVKTHIETVINALKTERDVSVRQRAVDLLYAMCDRSNAPQIVAEMLNYLETADYSIREEIVLKVAILAEKYAVDYTWYVDTILNLIRIAGDYVSEEVWYRVIQIVINRDDVQGYSAKTVFEALQAPACHENLVKVGGYILGEFGNLIAGDPRSSPLIQFNLLHSKFHLCSVPTRALLLSTYIKFVNLFPEIKATIQDVLRSDSQLRNADVELQQRAVEYLRLSCIASTDILATVLEEMPPFPERESSILTKLKKKKGPGKVPDMEETKKERNSDMNGSTEPVSVNSSAVTMVLKVAILAEKYAVDYTWYVDTILNLIRIAGDYCSPPPPPPPASSVDLLAQTLPAANRPRPASSLLQPLLTPVPCPYPGASPPSLEGALGFQALQAPACHENLVKVGGYILGEFGNLIAGDPRSSPLIQFNLLHSKFHLCSVPTRALLLSTYIKFVNLFPEIKATIQDVLRSDSQLRNADVELQQRAVEYLRLSCIASTDILTKQVDPAVDGGAQVQQILNIECVSDFMEAPILNIQFRYGGALQNMSVKLPVTLNKFFQPTEMTSQDFFQRWKQLSIFVCKNNGVLFENQLMQIGLKSEFRQNLGEYNSRTKQVDPAVDGGAQVQQILNIECVSDFMEAPILNIQFRYGGALQNMSVKLPVTLNKFFQPTEMTSQDFFQRWKQLSIPQQEVQKIFKAKHLMDTEVTKAKIIGFGVALLDMVDPNPSNFTGAGVIHTKNIQVGCLLRLEPNTQAQKLTTVNSYITYQGCHSTEKITIMHCEGSCGTFSKYFTEAASMEHRCSCCQETKTHNVSIALSCPDGRSLLQIQTDQCDCVTTACESLSSVQRQALPNKRSR